MVSRVLPPTYFWICLVLMVPLHLLIPVMRIVPGWYRLLGIPFLAFGAVLNSWADARFKRLQTTVKPHERPRVLDREGPFRFSRHPMYLGMGLALGGAALLLGSLSPWALVVVFVGLMEYRFIPLEEHVLEEEFKDRYREYRQRVRRWI
jgi:protein-S-isoprenylcysteine O-methyltransferase Ste14